MKTGYFSDYPEDTGTVLDELPGPPLEGDSWLLCYAQNATPAHQGFLEAARVYCKERDARLVVVPGFYHNPTSQWTSTDRSQAWWAPELERHLNAGRHALHSHLEVNGDVSIQPTASRPLSGLTYGSSSGIFGHPKLHWTTVPSHQRYYPRIFTTTGAITQPNYVKSKTGRKALEYHTIGACLVRKEGDLFHVRHVSWGDQAGFFDGTTWFGRDYSVSASPAALVMGDLHATKLRLDTKRRVDTMIDRLNPDVLVLHDVLDFESRTHHERDTFWGRYERTCLKKTNSVREETQRTLDLLSGLASKRQVVVVASNHDEMLEKWLLNADMRTDPENAAFFHELWSLWMRSDRARGLLESYAVQYLGPSFNNLKFLARGESFQVNGIECGFHGDRGPNGSRGNLVQYAKMGIPMVIGHSHTPGILDKVYQVGVTGDLDHGYNSLPSSWLETHCLIYRDGTRTLFNVIDSRCGF